MLAHIYTGKRLLYQVVAFAATYVLVVTGFDWTYFQATRGEELQDFLWPAALIGFFLPIVLPVVLYVIAKVRKNERVLYVAYAVVEAEVLGLAISSFYKVFTGRPGPHFFAEAQGLADTSQVWRFGVDRGGVFQGWPSSHTAVAFAASFALISLFPKNNFIKVLAFLYALYIGIGVSTNIHWFSDFAAGAVLGTIIGLAVGRSLRSGLPGGRFAAA